MFRLAFKIHSLRLRTVVTSMAALVNCTSNFRKTEVPSIATGSHLHFKKHNKTRQNFKKTCTSEEREDDPSNRVSPFRLKVPLCLQKNHAQGSALSISSCAISCEVHARSVYIISVSLTSEKSAQNFVHEGRANHSIQRFQKKNTFTQDRSLRFASSASCSVQTSKRVWHRRFVAQDRNNSFHERIFLPVSQSLLSILQHTFICKHINLPHLPHPFCFSLEIPFEMFPRSKSQPWLSS